MRAIIGGASLAREGHGEISKREKDAKAHITAHPFLTSRLESVEGLSVCILVLGGRVQEILISWLRVFPASFGV